MLSGDQQTKELRAKLERLQTEYDEFKIKAAKDFQNMEETLKEKHKKEIEALKARYEQ